MKDVTQRFKPGSRVLLFLDYDGTLVPIKKTPEFAVLHPLRRRFLKRLSEKVFICIVSGRSLAEIRKLVALRGMAYIGNHGLEISYGRTVWVQPEAKRIMPCLGKTLERIGCRTRNFAGVLIEKKGLTGSVHYRRLARPLWNPLKVIVAEEVGSKQRELKMTEGKRVFEIRPNVDWDKGRAVRELARRLDPKETWLRIYIGDDQTDEDAFRSLGRGSLTILVGDRDDTQARYQLADVDCVWKYLRALFQVMSRPK